MRGQLNNIAVAVYLTSLITLGLQIIAMLAGIALLDPFFAIIIFMFMQELSKLLTMIGDEDGEDSSS
jgi:hypothetical protein